jgi:hypothetical protein
MGKAMRKTEISGWMRQSSSKALRLSAVVLGVGILMSTHVARAGDDDDDDKTFEEKIIESIMRGVGGTNMDNQGIDYRERSPLVVPPKIDLPPPVAATKEVNAANWPKDPDEARRKAAIARRKKENKDPVEAARILTPSELNVGKTAPQTSTAGEINQPGVGDPGRNAILDPSQLGFDTSKLNIFKNNTWLGGEKTEVAPFKGEPTRDSLTQPPAGYQTPSPNFAYGTGPKESLNKEYNPAQGKYGE